MIPFSTVMLKTVTDITKKYKSMILVAFGGLFTETIFSIWWIFTLIGINLNWIFNAYYIYINCMFIRF